MRWFIFKALIVPITLFWSAAASACPACFWENPKGYKAYLGSTLLMSLLPLILIGGIGWAVYRYLRSHST